MALDFDPFYFCLFWEWTALKKKKMGGCMEGKNHRFGKADGVDMIRIRDSFLKKNFRNTSRKKILSGIGT